MCRILYILRHIGSDPVLGPILYNDIFLLIVKSCPALLWHKVLYYINNHFSGYAAAQLDI